MRFTKLSSIFLCALIALACACGPNAEEKQQKENAEKAAVKDASDRALAMDLLKQVDGLDGKVLSPELVDSVHKALSAKPSDSQARTALIKSVVKLESAVLFAMVGGPPPKMAAPWPETIKLVSEVADAEGKKLLEGTLARSEIFSNSTDAYSAYMALAKRTGTLDRQLAAVVGVQYASIAADDFPEKGPGWLRFLSVNQCAGSACVLPEVLSSLPPALFGSLAERAVAKAQAVNHLHGLATSPGLPDDLVLKLKKRSNKSLAKVRVPIYADLMVPTQEVEGDESSALVPEMSWPIAKHADWVLVVRSNEIGLAQKTEIGLTPDGPKWIGGSYTVLITGKSVRSTSALQSKAIRSSAAKVKELVGDSESRIAVQIAPDATGVMVGAAISLVKESKVRAPRMLVTDGNQQAGLPVWWVDVEERPESFPENSMQISGGVGSWTLAWHAKFPEAVQKDAVLPAIFKVRTLGRGKSARSRVNVTISEPKAALPTLKASLQLLTLHFGLKIEALRINISGEKNAAWIQSIIGAAQLDTAQKAQAWVEASLDENNELGGARAVSISTQATVKAERKTTAAKPKALPPALGYCQKRDIERVMKSRRGAFKFCYQRSLQMNPSLTGKITTRFRINDEGRVTAATVLSNTMDDRTVPKCLISNLKKLTFPRPQGGQCEVRWPFNFQSR